MTVEEKLVSILKRAAESENITNYEVIPHLEALRGDGFLSQFYTGDIKNKDTGELIRLYIKVPPPYEHGLSNNLVFANEYNFYKNIYPALVRFQIEKNVKNVFDKVPKFYCGSLEDGNEYLALENLKVLDYSMTDKTKFLDEALLKTLFETYGQYHALTFAFKEQNPEKFEELNRPLKDIFGMFDVAEPNVKEIFQVAYDHIKLTDLESAKKIQPLLDDFKATFKRGMFYEGKYSAFVHGDCWSNNMLFKYNANGDVENLRLLDHQLVRNSTPVHDLAYFFYSGASKRDFDKLDDYLQIYYACFSSHCRELGSDPEKLLPLETFKSDWKLYAFLGVIMGLMVWQVKLMPKADIAKLTQEVKEDALRDSYLENSRKLFQDPVFLRNISDILLHAIEINVI